MKQPYFIAEIGVNHNGSLVLAKKMILKAKNSGADCVKLQFFYPNLVVTPSAKLANYQKSRNLKTQLELIKDLALSEKQLLELKQYARTIDLDFLVSTFDENSLKQALKWKNQKVIKVPSGEITNLYSLYQIGLSKKNVIISTGGSSIREITAALNSYSKGYLKKSFTFKESNRLWKTRHVKKIITKKIILLHCVTNYPAESKESNLRSIMLLRDTFGTKVGWSDHTTEDLSAILAVAQGAEVFEKHVTLNKNLTGPDHKASYNFQEFKNYVETVKLANLVLGKYAKSPTKSEVDIIKLVRKRIFAKVDIKKGDKFSLENLIFLRGNRGLPAEKFSVILGRQSKQDLVAGDAIQFKSFI